MTAPLAPYTYDPALVTVSFRGIPVVGPFADGTFVKAKRNAELYTLKVGTDGGGTRAKLQDESGEVTFSLQHTSPSNDMFTAAAALDRTGLGMGALMIKDISGTTLVHCMAWVKAMPEAERGKEVGDTEWVLETLKLDMFVGGNFA